MTTKSFPKHARAVIIGGGIVGCSVAYHLAKLGWKDVVLLERKKLTCGTTWHAAGLLSSFRNSKTLTSLAQYMHKLYSSLEEETGVAVGYKNHGAITVAITQERAEELRRIASAANAFGVAAENISAADIASHCPFMETKDVVGGVWFEQDAQADSANLALALAKGAQQRGAQIIEDVAVLNVLQKDGRAVGVQTQQGDIAADYVVNAGGMWARQIAQQAGVCVPLHACEHFYIVTNPIDGLPPKMPALRLPDEQAYYKEDAGKILLGAFERHAKPWGMDGIAEDFCFDMLPEDYEHLTPVIEKATERFPILATAGVHTFFNGPESFTPDDRYLLGEAPELKNFYVIAGFNSVGIQSAGGAGKALAEWMEAGEPTMDLWEVDIRRMQSFQSNRSYLKTRVTETLGLLYDDHFPYRQYATARNIRRSPIHERLAAHGACFGELAGWERANWFLSEKARQAGRTATYEYSWQRQNWFAEQAAEHEAVRQATGLFDLSSFGKIQVCGADAETVLQNIAANNIAVECGRAVYTPFLNDKGGIEADVTVSRLAMDSFLVITPAATTRRDLNWIRRHIPPTARCTAMDVTPMEAVLAVMGPHSRDFLSPLLGCDLNNDDFPFGSVREVELGFVKVRAQRISFVGEFGWELYISADMALHAFDAIMQRAEDMPLKLCGMHALDSCRIEKSFRHFGHDISNEDHVLEAGLGFAVKTNKENFIGRDAVLQKRESGLQRRLVQFQLHDSQPLLYHNEPIWRDGEIAGYITSGNYGHTLGAAIGLGYVACRTDESGEDITSSDYQIEIGGQKFAAIASLSPLYDSKGDKMKFGQ